MPSITGAHSWQAQLHIDAPAHHKSMQMLLALLAALPTAVTALQPLNGIGVKPLGGAASIDVGSLLDKKAAVVFGTYAADFNAIEYGQRLRHYAPKLKERGVESLHLILNADESAASKFVELLGLEDVQACGKPDCARVLLPPCTTVVGAA